MSIFSISALPVKPRIILYSLVFCILAYCISCTNQGNAGTPAERDTTITSDNAYNNLFFDSLTLENKITTDSSLWPFDQQLREFYAGRNYQFAWFDTSGIAEQTANFLNLRSNFILEHQDKSLIDPWLDMVRDSLLNSDRKKIPDSLLLAVELKLTTHFFIYAQKAFAGNASLNMEELQWFIPRKKFSEVDFLDSLIANQGKNISNYAPVNRQYYLLQKFLEDYYRINKEESWGDTIPIPQKGYRLGDSLPEIALIKHKLRLLGDFYEPDSSHIFTDSLKVAVMRFQYRHGLTEDGVAGKQFIQQLNEPPVNRIRQILINMERLRWVPEEPETDFLLVNIPEYKLHVYEEGVHKFNMNVVVGQAQHNTVIFTGNLKYIVFSPYWNIPSGILGNEIIPAQRRNPYYLRNHNMEVVQGTTVIDPATINWSQYNGKNFPYMIRQRPGADNSLGRVKFLFPNEYNIYLHDTPAKSLFGESTRAFSHGCIRLSEPAKLAQFLLRNDSSWNEARIDSAMLSEVQKYVTLKDPVPVFIGYFTTWVDGKGKLHFRKDIYKHDEKMAEKMFTSSASL